MPSQDVDIPFRSSTSQSTLTTCSPTCEMGETPSEVEDDEPLLMHSNAWPPYSVVLLATLRISPLCSGGTALMAHPERRLDGSMRIRTMLWGWLPPWQFHRLTLNASSQLTLNVI